MCVCVHVVKMRFSLDNRTEHMGDPVRIELAISMDYGNLAQ